MTEITPGTLVERLAAQLRPEAQNALELLVAMATAAGVDVYLVGGAVRDLVLQRDNVDLDLAMETDVAPFAEKLAAATGGRCVLHERFGTATVSGVGFQLDLARTRSETYAHPGALPDVAPATLLEDLARRDFTINAMALRLTATPELVDPHRGLDDIDGKSIRVLHEASFQDDATRMLRAARYATRLGFAVESQTETWLQRDLPYLDPVNGPRLRRELQLIVEEPTSVEALTTAEGLGVLRAVHETLSLPNDVAKRLRGAFATGEELALRDETAFCVLAMNADDEGVTSLSARLMLAGRFENALRDAVRLRNESSKLATMRTDPVAAIEMLQHAAPSAVWATGIVAGGATAEMCDAYLREWRHIRPLLRGDDLLALGVQPGVSVGDTLRALRDARLRGEVTTLESEEALVGAMLQGRSV